jgi:histone H3/H4
VLIHSGSVIREIAYYQKEANEWMLLVPKLAMSRVIKDIVVEAGMPFQIDRISAECYALLHEIAERHLVAWFQMLYSPCSLLN